jgi:carbamoylphosphate synthase large subunit
MANQLAIGVKKNGAEISLAVGYLLDELKNDITRETVSTYVSSPVGAIFSAPDGP